MNAIYPLQNAKLHGYHVLLVYFEAMAEKLKGGLQNNVFCNDSALDWPLIHTRHVLTPRKLLVFVSLWLPLHSRVYCDHRHNMQHLYRQVFLCQQSLKPRQAIKVSSVYEKYC